jgi:ribosomal-protein-alanine N-acetyltransferase
VWKIQKMIRSDLKQVMQIENASFVSPWSRKSFESELKKDFGFSYTATAVEDKRVIAYIIGWLVADEIHIANIAVHPQWRRRGIAMVLMQKVIDSYPGFSWIRLEVRRSNLAARNLYRQLGFKEVGIRKRYYVQENEDAILMTKYLSAGKEAEVSA